jgi:hypothetical protein
MSVRYTATWYDVMQARQQDTHTPVSQLQLGQRVHWCQNGGAVCCDLLRIRQKYFIVHGDVSAVGTLV